MFFTDRSSTIIQDDVFERLTTLPNVVITGHQAFLTREALTHIAETTYQLPRFDIWRCAREPMTRSGATLAPPRAGLSFKRAVRCRPF